MTFLLLPLPFFAAILSIGVWARIALATGKHPARWWFHAFSAVTIFETLLTGVRFGYHYDPIAALQRPLLLTMPICLYLGFFSLCGNKASFRQSLHGLWPVAGLALFFYLPLLFDGLSLFCSLFYSLRLIQLYR